MSDRTNETCWLFVDKSNIRIEAQRAAAAGNANLPKLTDRDRDPCLRINVGTLADRLCKGRIRLQRLQQLIVEALWARKIGDKA
ncbi:hypothetical protein AAL_05280 [Moelleriella libera RCEF 2490]|uniref:Uncharacterized protein n=1 Tax=Moelleriella libera RCEF 2490 TaxID=1081109 RepID=A0A162IJC9_9HYPO|nr:hypothetical protein AAL_05280 [Moelleriella libera RCEF 2490]